MSNWRRGSARYEIEMDPLVSLFGPNRGSGSEMKLLSLLYTRFELTHLPAPEQMSGIQVNTVKLHSNSVLLNFISDVILA